MGALLPLDRGSAGRVLASAGKAGGPGPAQTNGAGAVGWVESVEERVRRRLGQRTRARPRRGRRRRSQRQRSHRPPDGPAGCPLRRRRGARRGSDRSGAAQPMTAPAGRAPSGAALLAEAGPLGHRGAGGDEGGHEPLRLAGADAVIAVDPVGGRSGDGLEQPHLTSHRHHRVPHRHDHRGRHVDGADPVARREPADGLSRLEHGRPVVALDLGHGPRLVALGLPATLDELVEQYVVSR